MALLEKKKGPHPLGEVQPATTAIVSIESAPKTIKKIAEEALTLTPADRMKIEEIKKFADLRGREKWTKGRIDAPGQAIRDAYSLADTCKMLQVNFIELAKEMSKRFPNQTINVLYEGCGMSTFPEEFEERCRREGLDVNVTRTDVYSKEVFTRLAAEESKSPKLVEKSIAINAGNYVQATPEELHEIFGDEKFHLIISRSGGMTYTPLPKVKGLYSISGVLHSKGEAHLLTETVNYPVMDDKYRPTYAVNGSTIRLKEMGKLTPEGGFFKNNPRLTAEEYDYHFGCLLDDEDDDSERILRIGRDLGPSQEWMDKQGYKRVQPLEVRAATGEEIEKYKTIFDLMEKPPIEMSKEQFQHLRYFARVFETEYGSIGRRGEQSGSLGGDLSLELRYGRYYITTNDEFGVEKCCGGRGSLPGSQWLSIWNNPCNTGCRKDSCEDGLKSTD